MNKIIIAAFAVSVAIGTTSCMDSIGETTKNIASKILPSGYKSDIKQGSELNAEQVEQLKIGMSKTEVKKIMGLADIIDPFRKNRWDYVNKSRIGNEVINKNLVLFFDKGNKLMEIKK